MQEEDVERAASLQPASTRPGMQRQPRTVPTSGHHRTRERTRHGQRSPIRSAPIDTARTHRASIASGYSQGVTESNGAENPTLLWTGERFIPGHGGETLALEHIHRYTLAESLCSGKHVLDLGCGSGYGTKMLGRAGAASVLAVDVDPEAARFVRANYTEPSVAIASATSLPFRNASLDIVVSFEVIEHITDPEGLVGEAHRVLQPNGILLVSTPNKSVYNEFRTSPNPYHVAEMELIEFRDLLLRHFGHVELLAQKVALASVLWPVSGADAESVLNHPAPPPAPPYVVALCSDSPIPSIFGSGLSFWSTDGDEQNLEATTYISHLEDTIEQMKGALNAGVEREAAARDQIAHLESRVDALSRTLQEPKMPDTGS